MLVDANVLLFATDTASAHHEPAAAWLTAALDGPVRIGIPWESINAYLRVTTSSRGRSAPVSHATAWGDVEVWLGCENVWTPTPTTRHAEVYARLASRYGVSGNLVPDAHLAALALEHGLAVVSADSDFARFKEVRWVDPVFGPGPGNAP